MSKLKEKAEQLEKLRLELKVKEQVSKVARYLAKACLLDETKSKDSEFVEATAEAWELFTWLPADICKKLGQAINDPQLVPEVLFDVRKIALGENEDLLTLEDMRNYIIVHKRGIGRQK